MQAIEQTRTWCWRFDAADLNNSKMVVDLVDSICVECGVDLSRRADLELVMTEVINNAIDHGVLGLDSAMKKARKALSSTLCPVRRGLQISGKATLPYRWIRLMII